MHPTYRAMSKPQKTSPSNRNVVRPCGGLVLLLLLTLAASARAATNSCKSLRKVTISAGEIGLPTQGAEVTSAAHHSQGDAAFCEVKGRIHPIDAHAQDIRFELNLPEQWNGKALQYGGGTFDGYVITGKGRTAVGLKSQATPLERGYATFGSDSGHHKNYFPLPDVLNSLNAKFARNPEMQRNFAGAALKKVHDVAVLLMTKRYTHAPSRMYFIGGSTGGREALRVAQRFPTDYDGVLAAYAAWDQIELDLQFIRTAQALYAPGGFLGRGQTKLIAHTVEQECDAQDGLKDRIIANPAACHVDIAKLRCEDGRAHGGCLSEAQMHTLETFASPQQTSVTLSHGVDSIPGYNVLSGADLTGSLGFLHHPMKNPIFLFNSFGYVIGDDVTRNFLTVGHHYDSRNFDVKTGGQYQPELLQQAAEIDSTDADLKPFASHGGKLILVHGTTDTVIPTNSTVDYYQRLQSTMGADATANFARLYLLPGMGHGVGRFNAGFDTISVLDQWADKNVAPRDLVVTDNHSGRTRPMCEWPQWPRYTGAGNTSVAASYTCSAQMQ